MSGSDIAIVFGKEWWVQAMAAMKRLSYADLVIPVMLPSHLVLAVTQVLNTECTS